MRTAAPARGGSSARGGRAGDCLGDAWSRELYPRPASPASYKQGTGTIVSGATASKATESALAAYPGGVVDRVVRLNNGEYEVHNIGVSWPHHIFVNQDFKVVGADS
jgi:hypothetical protein